MLFRSQVVYLLFQSAPLHDIGKVGIPDSILLKQGRLTPQEFEVMKTHARLGRASIERAEHELGLEVPFLRLAKQIAESHHEQWDGSGYPEGAAAFFRYIADWRTSGRFEGLGFSAASGSPPG